MNFPFSFVGDLRNKSGGMVMRAGFQPLEMDSAGLGQAWVQGVPITVPAGNLTLARAQQAHTEYLNMDKGDREMVEQLARGTFDGDVNEALRHLAQQQVEVSRAITTSISDFPVRENLEAQATSLVPEDTPLRNMLARVPGAGMAAVWIQAVSLGGGWGTNYDQPGGGTVKQLFYSETGAPVERTTVYQKRLAEYKLLGTLGSVTGFAMAAGANFMNQLATEKDLSLRNMFLNEEMALIWADSTSTDAPWGDGDEELAFDGLWNLIATANGTPSKNIQTSVGTLTTDHIDNQLGDIWEQGGRDIWMLLHRQEAQSLVKLLQQSGTIHRLEIVNQGEVSMGFRVAKYYHPITGQPANIIVDRFMSAGKMIFGSNLDDRGRAGAEVEVLPQVPVESAPEKPQQVQGYASVDLARGKVAPDEHAFMISVYEVLKLRNAKVFAKSSGVTAVS